MPDDIKFPEGEDPAELHEPEDAKPDEESDDTAQAQMTRPSLTGQNLPT